MAGLLVWDEDTARRRGVSFILWGLAVIAFGVAVLAWPGLTGRTLVMLVGLLSIAVGLVLAYGAFHLRDVSSGLWWAALVPAALVVVLGAIVLLYPEMVSRLLLVVVAVFVLAAAVWDVVSGLAMTSAFKWAWLRVLRGLVLGALAVWVILTPVSGVVALGWVIGIATILVGALSITTGVLARSV